MIGRGGGSDVVGQGVTQQPTQLWHGEGKGGEVRR